MTLTEYLVKREMAWEELSLGKKPSMLELTAAQVQAIAFRSAIYSDEKNDFLVADHRRCEKLWPGLEALMKERASSPENFNKEIVQ